MGYGRAAWAEVDLSAARRNMLGIKGLLAPGVRFCPVIKADGYGHGALAYALLARELGADCLGVAVLSEAVKLRESGVDLPILILGYTPEELAPLVVGNRITQTVFSLEQAQALSGAAVAQGRVARVHVKVDTGMGRLGVSAGEALAFCSAVAALPGLELEGVFTHFAAADEADKSGAIRQFSVFEGVLRALEVGGIRVKIRHCANSAAVLDLPQTHLDMVRPGIILYGLWPSTETTRPLPLEGVMRLKARFSQVKRVKKGTALSYGGTFVCARESRIGTIPLGYADGYSRLLSNRARVWTPYGYAPIVGRVCMDQCLADLTDLPEEAAGAELTLFGCPELPADEVAALLGSINYEVTCAVNARVPRIYL